MSGSRRYFGYTADNGDLWGVELDESTAEIADLGFTFPLDTTASNYQGVLKVTGREPIALRYFNVAGTDSDGRTIRRRVYCGAPDAAAWLDPQSLTVSLLTVVGNTATPTNFSVTSAIGEKRTFIPNQDTGAIDGDIDNNVLAPAP